MGVPSISHWIDTIANPHGRFRTLGEFEAEHDAYGNVRFTAGNNAVVFPIRMGKRRMMIKCYTRDNEYKKTIYDFIAKSDDDLLPDLALLVDEAYVYDELGHGQFRDILVGEWVEGNTLETEIKRAGREFGAPRFTQLATIFDNLALKLLSKEWAHGDLKPENIVITEDQNAILIDYDAMFIPGFEKRHTIETGTPSYQHPLRNENHYGSFLDDYPIVLICVSLHALALDPRLYDKYHKSDNIILNPDEIINGHSEAFTEIEHLFAGHGEYGLYELASLLKSPSPEIPALSSVLRRVFASQHNHEASSPELFGDFGLWGYKTHTGDVITGAIFDEAYEFSCGLGVARLGDIWHVIDPEGRKKIDGTRFQRIKPFGCGLAAYQDRAGKWGYIDTEGNTVIAARFDKASTMHENMAAVTIDGKAGYIDSSGRMVIDPIYERAYGFRNGRATVISDGIPMTIDSTGKKI